MSEPMSAEVAEAWDWLLRVHDSDPSQERLKIVRDHVDRLAEALEANRPCGCGSMSRDAAADFKAVAAEVVEMRHRAERAEADLADEKRRHGGLRAGVEALAARAEKFAYMEPSGMGLANELRALLSDTTTCACGGTGSGCRCERETLSDTTIGEPT